MIIYFLEAHMAKEKKEKKERKKIGIIGEFKAFISRGNVLDMAVGLIIGSAFTSIVNSLVGDIFMPLLGMITGKIDFSELKLVLQEAVMEGEEIITAEVAVKYGSFIQYIINFLLIAISVFLMIKAINIVRSKADKKAKAEAEAKAAEEAKKAAEEAAKPDPQLVLLTEIRDLLKK